MGFSIKNSSSSLPLLSIKLLFHKGFRPFMSAAITMFCVNVDDNVRKGSRKGERVAADGLPYIEKNVSGGFSVSRVTPAM